MNKIAIIGAGGFGKEVAMLIEQINAAKPQWHLIGFFDDGVRKAAVINGYRNLGSVAEINQIKELTGVVIAIADCKIRAKLETQIHNTYIYYPTLIHPNVLIGNSEYTKVSEGCIITAGNIITVNVEIGRHVILNLGCTVGHDTLIGDYSSVMPSVNISGGVKIHTGVYIGTGAQILNHLEVGSYTIIGAGAVVTKSVPANCTAVGIPAKPIKFH